MKKIISGLILITLGLFLASPFPFVDFIKNLVGWENIFYQKTIGILMFLPIIGQAMIILGIIILIISLVT